MLMFLLLLVHSLPLLLLFVQSPRKHSWSSSSMYENTAAIVSYTSNIYIYIYISQNDVGNCN